MFGASCWSGFCTCETFIDVDVQNDSRMYTILITLHNIFTYKWTQYFWDTYWDDKISTSDLQISIQYRSYGWDELINLELTPPQ